LYALFELLLHIFFKDADQSSEAAQRTSVNEVAQSSEVDAGNIEFKLFFIPKITIPPVSVKLAVASTVSASVNVRL
jgi:hypothetical protein